MGVGGGGDRSGRVGVGEGETGVVGWEWGEGETGLGGRER